MLCVYCGIAQGSNEHWFPRAFGVFKNYEMLKDRVCKTCNEATKLPEQAFARYGMNGIIRRKLGVKGRNRGKGEGDKTSPFHAGLAGLPPLQLVQDSPLYKCQVFVHITEEGGIGFARQIIVSNEGKNRAILIPERVKTTQQFRAFLDSCGLKRGDIVGDIIVPVAQNQQLRAFAEVFPQRKQKEPETKGLAPEHQTGAATMKFVHNDLHARAAVKIAFHYMLRFWGDRYQGNEPEFQQVREFIQGKSPVGTEWGRFARLTKDGIKAVRGVPSYYGHLIGIERMGKTLEARMRFFLGPEWTPWTWRVNLGSAPGTIHFDDRIGHFFRYFEKQEGQFHGELLEQEFIRSNTVFPPGWTI